jgi:hypothetical protein
MKQSSEEAEENVTFLLGTYSSHALMKAVSKT